GFYRCSALDRRDKLLYPAFNVNIENGEFFFASQVSESEQCLLDDDDGNVFFNFENEQRARQAGAGGGEPIRYIIE
ncbi:unnamed protein product, partial [Amoebophrya sp. A25]